MRPPIKNVIIIGGAGFIGSHFTDFLLAREDIERVRLYDNFSSGREWHYEHHAKDSRLSVVKGDVKDLTGLTEAMKGFDLVIHLASNPDIAAAMINPAIDFHEGTYLTFHVVEAMRLSGASRLLYASGSGVYGDLGEVEATEDYAPMRPTSTYGASKLAGEALISSYASMFGLSGCAFRFGNVVGSRQTHGVGYDFARRLIKNPDALAILGDGMQSKSYIHVDDVMNAVWTAHEKTEAPFQVYNVATGDYVTVREIADIACDLLSLSGKVAYEFTGGRGGWKGDVPVVRLNTDRIKSLGWRCQRDTRRAIADSISAILTDLRAGRIV
ncbi:MAG: NAD-dependent epimerase/dehydratase family protein [Alphaproteobacteria bacterium]|nr:NAD-dependent epimerase/dehydratase family protein [Alphaproteobacteria bacterium]